MTKIEALEKTIYNLENDVYTYKWDTPSHCNCGILAKSILGKQDEIHTGTCLYSENARCMTTGLDVGYAYSLLMNAGFIEQDVLDLEFLKNERICEVAGIKILSNKRQPFERWTDRIGEGYREREVLIKYLKAWVEILKEEKPNSEPLVQECDATMVKKVDEVGSKIIHIYHKVEVPETISKSVPETILS